MKRGIQRWGVPIDLLWPLVILAGLTVYVSLIPLPPNDFWWHLKIGELIHTTSCIPTTNIFAWTLPADTPFTYGAWLGEYLLYRLYHLGGLPLVIFTRTLLATFTFALVGYEAQRRAGSWRIAALGVVFAGLMSLNNLIVRPQIWSWLPFMIFYILLSRYVDGKISRFWLLLCPVLMIFWVNAHGAFVLGPVLVGMFLAGEALRSLFHLEAALPWKKIGWLGFILLLSLITTAVNPQFVGIYGYVFNMMTDRPSQGLVVEWQSPTPNGIANIVFFVSIVMVLLVLTYSRYTLTPTSALLLVGFLWLAWTGQRYVVWYGMVAMPLLIEALDELIPRCYVHAPSSRHWLNLLLILLLWVPVIAVQPWFVEAMPFPETYWDRVWRDVDVGPLLDVRNPVAAVHYLKEHPGGRLFNEMGYGSYLIWAVPEQRVFIDPRVELYPYEQWMDYIRIGRGMRYNEILSEYGVDRMLLDVAQQEDLVRLLPEDPLWEMEYEDAYAQVWRRK
jgi:hypothetical protein